MQDRGAINRMLKTHGLPGLEEPGILQALAFMVTDHERLRSMLARCEPENRVDMYNSLKPYLNFTPRPLDTYIAESAERAEREKLPTIDAEGGLHWSKMAPEIRDAQRVDIDAAQSAVNVAFAKHTLIVTCRSCTKQEQFTGDTKYDAVLNARLAGWVYYVDANGKAQEICPACPAVRKVS